MTTRRIILKGALAAPAILRATDALSFSCQVTPPPGVPTNIAVTSASSTSLNVSLSPPTTGGPTDYGVYSTQYQVVGAGSFTAGPTVKYCTTTGFVVDSFNNTWTIGATGPNGLFVNAQYVSPTNNVSQVMFVPTTNTIWQFGSGSWYSLVVTQNYGNTPPTTAFSGPFTSGPLSSIVITGLTTGQTYNVQANVSNSGGTGPWSTSVQGTPTAATLNQIIWGGQAQWRNGVSVATRNAAIASTGQRLLTLEDYYTQGWNFSPPFDGFQPLDMSTSIPASAGGFPMLAISPNNSGTVAQTMLDIINGVVDGNITSMLDTWANAGYTRMCVRPLWEINFNGLPIDPNYSAAWQHIANLVHNYTRMKVYTIYNPGQMNAGLAYYPTNGDTFVDWIGPDASANWSNQGVYSSPLDLTQANFSIGGAASFAAAHNKPLALCESGVTNSAQNGVTDGANSENHLTTLSATINASQTSFVVANATGYPAAPFPIQIDSEWLNVTAVNTGTRTLTIGPYSGIAGTGRAFNGTTAAAHNSGAQVTYGGYCAWCCNTLTVIRQTGVKLILCAWYDDNGGDVGNNGKVANELWNTVAADTQAIINFINLATPLAWTGNLSTTGH